jgi:hypothetical protein
MINIYNATFIEIEACPRTLRTALVYVQNLSQVDLLHKQHNHLSVKRIKAVRHELIQ